MHRPGGGRWTPSPPTPTPGFDLVALSTYTARAFDAYKVADAYRARGVPVVFGGLHATVLPDEVAAPRRRRHRRRRRNHLARSGARLPGGGAPV